MFKFVNYIGDNDLRQASVGSVGYDLIATEIKTVKIPDSNICSIKVYTGIKLEMPTDVFGLLGARSNIAKTGWMLSNGVGIIDSDYRGELILMFHTYTHIEFPYKVGDRVGQIVFMNKLQIVLTKQNTISTTDRNDGGFGSTGL